MKINTDMASLSAQNGIYSNHKKYVSSLEKLSTGLRINRASDDAGGLSISENLRAQKIGLHAADRNAQNGISALQVAEGSLNEVSSILQRMRELSIESSTSTLTNTDRGYLDGEFDELRDELDRITASSEFNTQNLLDGSWSSGDLQVGANNSLNDRIATDINQIDSTNIGIGTSDISDSTNALTAIDSIDTAIDSINYERSHIGAFVNRLEHSINNLKTSALNISAAESLIRDTDVAHEMYEFTKSQLNLEFGTNALASSFKSRDSIKILFGLDN